MDGHAPLLSIITVTKNCTATIGRTLQSVQEIKSSEIEYIVIDGESTDGTLDIIRQTNGLIDMLVTEPDSGVYNAMNKGAMVATGRYILFLNGDDWLIADGFKQALEILSVEKPMILCCRSGVCWPHELTYEVLSPRPFLLPFFNTIPHLSTFISAEIQKSFTFREDLKIASDYDLFLRLFLRGYHFRIGNPIIAVHYRGGVSGDINLSIAEIERVKKDNLGVLYIFIRFMELLNRLRKRVFISHIVKNK